MISNISRIKEFKTCSTKMKYHQIEGLEESAVAIPLMTGGAFHEGAAEFLAHRDVKAAVQVAETKYRERLEGQMILPEERVVIEQQIGLARRMVDVFASHFSDSEMTVISPEVEFCVPLEKTLHHCHFFHKLLYPDVPFEQCQRNYQIAGKALHGYSTFPDPHECWQPHYFRGKTDAVISWKGKIWLLEHKTTAMTGSIFYDKFFLDFQTTGYLYGIGKAIGTRPHGFLLNVLKKPNKNAKDQLAVGFEREPYLRSDEDISRFEKEFIRECNRYENAVINNDYTLDGVWNEGCFKFNRRCYFWDVCKNHGLVVPEQFRQREPDYVDLEYYKILGLTPPERRESTQAYLPQEVE